MYFAACVLACMILPQLGGDGRQGMQQSHCIFYGPKGARTMPGCIL